MPPLTCRWSSKSVESTHPSRTEMTDCRVGTVVPRSETSRLVCSCDASHCWPLVFPLPAATHKPRLPLPFLGKLPSSPMVNPSPVSFGMECSIVKASGRTEVDGRIRHVILPCPCRDMPSWSCLGGGGGSVVCSSRSMERKRKGRPAHFFSPALCLETPNHSSVTLACSHRGSVQRVACMSTDMRCRDPAVYCFLLLPMRLVSETLTISSCAFPIQRANISFRSRITILGALGQHIDQTRCSTEMRV